MMQPGDFDRPPVPHSLARCPRFRRNQRPRAVVERSRLAMLHISGMKAPGAVVELAQRIQMLERSLLGRRKRHRDRARMLRLEQLRVGVRGKKQQAGEGKRREQAHRSAATYAAFYSENDVRNLGSSGTF